MLQRCSALKWHLGLFSTGVEFQSKNPFNALPKRPDAMCHGTSRASARPVERLSVARIVARIIADVTPLPAVWSPFLAPAPIPVRRVVVEGYREWYTKEREVIEIIEVIESIKEATVSEEAAIEA
jgi:hypothetical protein